LFGNRSHSGGGVNGGSLTGCILMNNATFGNGGGAYNSGLTNCLLAANVAHDSGGGAYKGGLVNCTMVDNWAEWDGGGAYFSVLRNCIAQNNLRSGRDGDEPNDLAGGQFLFVCSPDVSHGINGCITNNALFVNYFSGDFRLASDSPCIDIGNNTFILENVDLDGKSRIFNGVVDLGSYEVQSTHFDPDEDNDGIPDEWEQAYFGDSNNCDPNDDPDGDTINNSSEYVAGSNPTNTISVFAITNVIPAEEGFVVQWSPSVDGRVYSVFWTESLTSDYTPMVTNLLYPQDSYTDTFHNVELGGVYKINVRMK
jgi:hypothetical protein